MPTNLAHLFDASTNPSGWWLIVGVVGALALVIEHHFVAGFDRAQLARRARLGASIVMVAALTVAVAPTLEAQPAGSLLPDLISDPPRPSYFNELNTADGGTRLVLTFDGYVHNVGEGALDVVGNPQEPGGMQQRVLDGGEWADIGSPTVRYETDDGHNHFHLIEVVEYVLWNELQGALTATGSKIGFCLVDSEQIEPGTDQAYSEELDDFCQEGNPGATDLRMGISPGWRDIYDAQTTLQWVDVSNVAPGRYWIGAITDPGDEILESNETNNELIFSEKTIAVPGFSPRSQDAVAVPDGVAEFTLTSSAHGSVASPVYVIEQGPASGELDVPIGADLGSPTVRYFPSPGFVGTDQIVFSVHDAASPYPRDHPTQTIEFEVAAGAGTDSAGSAVTAPSLAPSLIAPSTFFETELGATFALDLEAVDVRGDAARLFATGLPAGLVADPDTNTIRGIAAQEGIFNVTLMAVGATPAEVATLDVTWIVNPSTATEGLSDAPDQSSPRGELTRVRLGSNGLTQTYEADGLPPGLAVDDTAPVVAGTPTETGTFDVVIRQLEAGKVVAEISFIWTIRATTAIDFVL